jgi:uncharacterized protein (TIGR02453 family)
MGYFDPELFTFLKQLKRNNDREWFAKNKQRYIADVQQPALDFISDAAGGLRKISASIVADPRPVGGSLFRIYRDTRFAKDKSPYKTHVGIWFAHRAAKDVHSPGYYLHLEPGQVFFGAGLWMPDTKTATAIRDAIVAKPAVWKKAAHSPPFSKSFSMSDEGSLKRPPRGYDPEHPYIDDLRRKSFIGSKQLDEKTATSSRFMETFLGLARDGAPLVKFISESVGVSF